jgi:hypothetical protein
MTTENICYQATVHAGAWGIWDNSIWYPALDAQEIRFEMKQGDGFHRPIISLKGLVIDLKGRVYGERTMNRPQQEGYAMHGRVSVGGKKYQAFTSTRLFQRADGSLVDVAVFIISDPPNLKWIPPHDGWKIPTAEEVASWADDAAAVGRADLNDEIARVRADGIPHADLIQFALSYRGEGIGHRLAGRIEAAVRYEELSEENIDKYRAALQEDGR